MLRFAVTVWNASDPESHRNARDITELILATAPGMKTVVSVAGMSAVCAGLRPGSSQHYTLEQRAGIVFGQLFRSKLSDNLACPSTVFDVQESASIVASGGKRLIENYWGRYVAFVIDRTTTHVLRDPTGAIPCYRMTIRGVHVFFSHVEDCVALNPQAFTINWRYVQASLLRTSIETKEAGLNEVSNVRQGERVTIRAGEGLRRERCWNPAAIAQARPIECFDEAVAEARRTLQACIGAWASCYPHIVLRYSGGLDCTVVLACLHRAQPRSKITCLNYTNAPGNVREQSYIQRAAMAAAKGQRHEFIELQRPAADMRAAGLLELPRFPSRPLYHLALGDAPYDGQLALDRGAALFDGFLGDQLFYTDTSPLATDYVWQHHLGRRLIGITRDMAKNQGRPLLPILWEAVRGGLFKGRPQLRNLPRVVPFVNPAVLEDFAPLAERYLGCYWLADNPGDLPPGKRTHIEWLCWPSAKLNPFERPEDPDELVPLASQPLYELFLRMPSYVLCHGGLDRTVVRRAFADALPAELLSARNYVGFGALSNPQITLFRKNRQFMRELLLDGILVAQGYLSRDSIEAFFRKLDTDEMEWTAVDLALHADLEIWLRSWRSSASSWELRSTIPVAAAAVTAPSTASTAALPASLIRG